MLSFRFQLTSAQLDVLLSIYAGGAHPSSKVTDDTIVAGSTFCHPHYVPIVARLQDKGLVVHVDRPVRRGETTPYNDGRTRGAVCTERGRMVAQMAVEAAQRLIGLAKVAESRGLHESSREEGVA
jgi:hypothetical protein